MRSNYKLSPPIVNFIKNIKTKEQNLGCRKIVSLIKSRFGVTVSKSAVNLIIKQAQLSSPVGRKAKIVEGSRIKPIDNMGLFFLKAADVALKFSETFSKEIKRWFSKESRFALQKKTESLIYLPYFTKEAAEKAAHKRYSDGLWQIIGKSYRSSTISSYLIKLQQVREINSIIAELIKSITKEVAYLKVKLANGASFYLDAQLHSVYSTFDLPRIFSVTINKIKDYINDSIVNPHSPLVIFSFLEKTQSPIGLFNLLSGMGAPVVINPIVEISAISPDEIEVYNYKVRHRPKRIDFIIGLNPKISHFFNIEQVITKYKPISCDFFWERLYIAEANIKITKPDTKQTATLRCAILTNHPHSQGRLAIATNIPKKERPISSIVREYLRDWPNYEVTLGDFKDKTRHFRNINIDYSRKINSNLLEINKLDTTAMLQFLRHVLHHYCQRYFFPQEWLRLDFVQIAKRIYSLKAKVIRKKRWILVDFFIPSNYYFFRELIYACNRVNEHNLVTSAGTRVFFRVKFG